MSDTPARQGQPGAAPTSAPASLNSMLIFWLGLAVIVAAVGVVYSRWLTGTQRDIDEGFLLMTARLMGHGFGLYTEVWADQPPGVPLSLLAGFHAWGESVESGRLVTVLYSLAGLVGVAAIAYQLAGRLAGLTAPLFLALTPNFFWLTRSVQHDIPPLGTGALALAAAVAYSRGGRRAWLVAAGALMAWAVALKLTALLLGVPLAALVFIRIWTTDDWRSELHAALLAIGAGALLVTLPLLLVFDVPAFLRQVVGTPLMASGVWPNRAPEYAQWMLEYLFVENLGLTVFALLGMAVLWARHSLRGLIIVGWFLLTAIVLVNQRPLFALHHFAMLLFPLAVLAGVGLSAAWQILRAPRQAQPTWLVAATLCVALAVLHIPRQVGLLRGVVEPPAKTSLQEAADWIQANTQPDDLIVADPPMIAFRANRSSVPWLVDLSSKRIETGALTNEEAIAATEAANAPVIALWGRRLRRLDSFETWVKSHYIPVVRDEHRVIYARFDPAAIQHPQAARLGDVAELLGYDLAVDPATRQVKATLYWRALSPTPVNYTVFTDLLDAQGRSFGQSDGRPDHQRTPTSTWTEGQLIVDERTLTVAPGAPPQTFLDIGLYDTATGARLPVVVDGQRVNGDQVRLNTAVTLP